MKPSSEHKARAAVREAAAYLRSCGIRLPRFRLTTQPPEGRFPFGGAFVVVYGGGTPRLNMGHFPTAFHRHWFAMHELGHLLWELHRPLRWENFRAEFGGPRRGNYHGMHARESWKTAGTWKASWHPGPHRPHGEPSWYGVRAGGEERFCELLGLMWANADFAAQPPHDLAGLWDTCWKHGLARMT